MSTSLDKLLDLEENLQKAIHNGEPTYKVNGQNINAIDLLQTIQTLKSEQAEMSGNLSQKETETVKNRLALNVFRNLENQEFKYSERITRDAANYEIRDLEHQPLAHQNDAIRILQNHWQTGSPGILIADDMGLGKTFQTLAFLSWIRQIIKNGLWPQRPILVVAPTGLIQNWFDEIKKHLKTGSLGETYNATGQGLAALKMNSSSDRSAESNSGFPTLDLSKLRDSDIVITTYESIRDFQFSFAKVHWSVLVFDEMQKIKNPKTRMTDAAKALKADFIIGLTGTPVENRLLELWCLIDTIKPCYLGSLKQFIQEYEGDQNLNEAKLLELNIKLTKHNQDTPLMLRRMKSDVLKGLPEKKIEHLEQLMEQKQATEYSKIIKLAKNQKGEKGNILAALQGIKAVSLHPDLIKNEISSDECFFCDSARLTKLLIILNRIKKADEKALIFCETRLIQGVLADLLKQHFHMDHLPFIINGEVPGRERKKKVDIFQSKSGFDIMILSPKAGGVGLTLTAANHVIHLTRWWNPAVEDQCTDRVFRIGQEKTVYVYIPKAIHPDLNDSSFDCLLDELLTRKRTLNQKTLAPTEINQNEAESLFKKVTGIDNL